jgi:hypothetical protein
MQLQFLVNCLAVVACLGTLYGIFISRRFVEGLTLMSSWRWGVATLVTTTAAVIVNGPLVSVSPGWKTASSYFAATMLLTPLIATLGARRPGHGPWQWFVVLPMIIVLQWPSVTQLVSSGGREGIELGAPATTGVLLVILMSAGTLVGRSMFVPALLYIAAVLCSLLPASGWTNPDSSIPLLSPFLLAAALASGGFTLKSHYQRVQDANGTAESVDAVWMLFQSLYGLAWSRRVLERINQFGPGELWTVRLTFNGFRRPDGTVACEQELTRPLEAFRWVLTRFADPQWITSHLKET